jgi:hypothetical protein
LNDFQVTGLILAWWASRGICGKIERFLNTIRPNAWKSEESFVIEWQDRQLEKAKVLFAGKTVNWVSR